MQGSRPGWMLKADPELALKLQRTKQAREQERQEQLEYQFYNEGYDEGYESASQELVA